MRRLPLLAVVLAVGCGVGTPGCDSPEPVLVLRGSGRQTALTVEIADGPAERTRGLMGRADLSEGRGMAFLFEGPTENGFTMRDTLIPLSIAFWDGQGIIVDILHMKPCREEPCPTYRPRAPYVGAVEANRGYFEERGIGIGDRVELQRARPCR